MILKWHATCPLCTCSISRKGMLSETIKCPKCGAALEQNKQWNQNVYLALGGLGLLALVAAFLVRRVASTQVCLAAVMVFLVAVAGAFVWAWPFVTKYEPATSPETSASAAPMESGDTQGKAKEKG